MAFDRVGNKGAAYVVKSIVSTTAQKEVKHHASCDAVQHFQLPHANCRTAAVRNAANVVNGLIKYEWK